MDRALRTFIVEGIQTTIPLHLKILAEKRFRSGDISTTFLEQLQESTVVEPA